MKRLVALAAIVLTLCFAVGGTASAFVGSPTLDAKVRLAASKTSAVATGTVVCEAGHAAEITVIIQQASGTLNAASQGTAPVDCSGQVQAWSVTTHVAVGAAFKKGPAVALFSANDTTDGTGVPVQTRGVKLT